MYLALNDLFLRDLAQAPRYLRESRLKKAPMVICACLPALVVLIISTLAMTTSVLASSESVIYSFANPPDGYGPQSNLVVDAAGDKYGTTVNGGVHNRGSVFVVTSAGSESVIYSFAGGSDGANPIAGLFRDKKTGNMYGTTLHGGTANVGTVFMVTPGGVETVLYSFKGAPDGANPYSGVVRVGTNIFGTTNGGGAYGYGMIFKLTATGHETDLHDFNSAFPTLDGSFPYAGLLLHKGVLYGTTTLGGTSNLGTVFSITPKGAYSLLYSFQGGSNDGQNPYGGVAFDTNDNLYGTTYDGGHDNAGVVYELAVGGVETVLHSFLRNGSDGINPYANLIFHGGKLYGTTTGGNASGGTVYKITLSGSETVMYSFAAGTDGYNPYAGLVFAPDKAFYGTTLNGGTSKLGTVFKVVP